MRQVAVAAARALAALWLVASGAAPAAGVAAPESWRKQTFPFPLPFVSTIDYEGTEHVRFSPWWDEFAAERGFTYVVLWDIRRREMPPQEIERALKAYFDGLMETITKAREIEDPGTVSAASLHPMATPTGWSEAYSGRVWTWNAFSKGEKLVLHVEVTVRPCGAERMQVFHAFSMAARDHAAWRELRAIRDATGCE